MAQPPPPYAPSDQYPPQGYPPPGQYPPQGQPGYPPPGQYPPQGQPGYPPPGQYPEKQPGGYLAQPQQPGYAATTHHTTVITQQPAVVHAAPIIFHEFPVALTCPTCRAQIVSAVHYDVGTFAWLLFFLMFCFGFWLCCFIPFCIDSCKDAIHHCPNCSAQLGVYRRM